MANREDRFTYENPQDSENQISVYIQGNDHWERGERGKLRVSVADEMAVDSYNSTFECAIYLPIDVAKRLRDYLIKVLP